jgi:hypothetical protein
VPIPSNPPLKTPQQCASGLFEVLVYKELLYSNVPLFEVVAVCKSSNQLLKSKGSVEVSLLQRVGMI